jgi:nickel-dependent lactate racemase
MMLWQQQAEGGFLSDAEMRQGVCAALGACGPVKKMLVVPPDVTRLHSGAGTLTRYAYERDPSAVAAILPALGTHAPMTAAERAVMFGDLPERLFLPHDWRSGCIALGEIPAGFVNKASGGAVNYAVPVAVNRLLVKGGFDCILSIGQVVPHEVAGFAGHAKNLFVGLGGPENIHKSHFLGAVYGMERIMGRADTPVRAVFDLAIEMFLPSLPVIHVLTVVARDGAGVLRPAGLFIGTGRECFEKAAALSRRVNITLLPEPLRKVVTYLDPAEYKSFWLGNKSIYRTRMAIADGGELVVLAPGIERCGEDQKIDALIREFGYCGTPAVMKGIGQSAALRENLSAAAHLMHGSSEGRFKITYCTGKLDKSVVRQVGFDHAPLSEFMQRYNPKKLQEGANTMPDGEEIFYISNPATGLWAWEGKVNQYKKN